MTYIIKTHIKVLFGFYVNLFLSVKYFQVNIFWMFGCNPEKMTKNDFQCFSWIEFFF